MNREELRSIYRNEYYPLVDDPVPYDYWLEGQIINFKQVSDDTKRLDKLQSLTKGYGNGWILRESFNGRGMRLHETTLNGAENDVRKAIDKLNK